MRMTDIEIHIPGQPFFQKRHRDRKKKGGGRRRYDPSATDKKTIKENLMFYKPSVPFDGPVVLDIEAYFQTPQSWSGVKQERHEGQYRPKKPDCDNIEKIYCDAMNGMIYNDDNQIVHSRTRKFYSMKPRIVIRIKELQPVE